MGHLYAYFDGDDVGSRLELLLLDDKSEEAASYSRDVSRALVLVHNDLSSRPDVSVLVAGGDDVLARWPAGALTLDDVEAIRVLFHEACGQTLSVGIGSSLHDATINLRRAKLLGKARIINGCE